MTNRVEGGGGGGGEEGEIVQVDAVDGTLGWVLVDELEDAQDYEVCMYMCPCSLPFFPL